MESQAGHGRRRVGAETGEGGQVRRILGKPPAATIPDDPGGPAHVPGALIIAQAFPGFEHLLERRPGERLEIGKGSQPGVIIGDDGSDRRLLEHDFRHPDAIGIARPAPGKVALAGGVPTEKPAGEKGVPAFVASPVRFRGEI